MLLIVDDSIAKFAAYLSSFSSALDLHLINNKRNLLTYLLTYVLTTFLSLPIQVDYIQSLRRNAYRQGLCNCRIPFITRAQQATAEGWRVRAVSVDILSYAQQVHAYEKSSFEKDLQWRAHYGNVMSSVKLSRPYTHLKAEDQATAIANMRMNWRRLDECSIQEVYARRQTDRQTDMLIAILRI